VGANSKIEWTDATWNPLRARSRSSGKLGTHCVKVSPGCEHCYAEAINRRFGTGLTYRRQANVETFADPRTLTQPLAWQRPRRVFVGSMTDVFGEWVERHTLAKLLGIAAYCRRHTFQFLTKRPERMCVLLAQMTLAECLNAAGLAPDFLPAWPLANVWLGVTAEDQQRADERIPWLLKTPAAARFVSCEPLLGPINLNADWIIPRCSGCGRHSLCPDSLCDGAYRQGPVVNWLIAGGESGPQARPCHPDWARSLRDQCRAAGVPFFFKQWGDWAPVKQCRAPAVGRMTDNDWWACDDGRVIPCREPNPYGQRLVRFGKKSAGRLLDGREWSEFPQVETAHA
jgi:protein gp37